MGWIGLANRAVKWGLGKDGSAKKERPRKHTPCTSRVTERSQLWVWALHVVEGDASVRANTMPKEEGGLIIRGGEREMRGKKRSERVSGKERIASHFCNRCLAPAKLKREL